MFSSQTKGPLFSALFRRTCTVVGHTHTQRYTRTIPAFMHTQWFSGHTQTVASYLFASPLLLLLLFTKQHRTLLSPEEKEQNLQEEHRGSVELLYTGEQHPFDWEPEVRAWLPKPAGFFGACVCLCSLAFVCVLASGRLLMLRESHKLFFCGKLKSHDSTACA